MRLPWGTVASVFAQGNVAFRNNASTSFYFYTNTVVGSLTDVHPKNRLISGTSSYRIGLYASPTTEPISNSLTLVALATNSAALPGRFLGPSLLVLPAGYPAGSPITFQIRVWSFAGGMSYEEALNAQSGDPFGIVVNATALGTVTPTANFAPIAALFCTTAGLVQGLEMRPIPEPSSIALGLLGLGTMALFRRKK